MNTPNNAAALTYMGRQLTAQEAVTMFANQDATIRSLRDELAALRATLAHEASGADWHWLRTDDWSEIVQAMPLGDDRYATGYQDAMNAVTRKLCSLPRPVINPAQPDALTSQPSGEAPEWVELKRNEFGYFYQTSAPAVRMPTGRYFFHPTHPSA